MEENKFFMVIKIPLIPLYEDIKNPSVKDDFKAKEDWIRDNMSVQDFLREADERGYTHIEKQSKLIFTNLP